MNLTGMTQTVTRTFGRSILHVRKASPELLVGAGVVGIVAAGIMACRATLKIEKVVDELQNGLYTVGENQKVVTKSGEKFYSDQEILRDRIYLYGRATTDFIKLYGPSIAVGALSVSAILSSHHIMRQRNLALTAAYAALERGYNAYQKRVAEAVGEDREFEIRHGLTVEEAKDETGKEVVKVVTSGPPWYSQYARFFEATSPYWDRTPEYNLLFVRNQQNYMNDLLHSRGHVFLNEVYDALGIPRSQAGQVVGWVISKDGDNFIDFGIYDFYSERARAFVNGQEGSILLDFNVDGVVYDKI